MQALDERELVDRRAAELVEEILALIRENQGIPMFLIVVRKMRRLIQDIRK